MHRDRIKKLDNLADLLQSRSLHKYAAAVDEVSNLLEESEPLVEQIASSLRLKNLDDPCFSSLGDLLKKEVHSNSDSAIIKNLGHFNVDSKSSASHMVDLIKNMMHKGVALHEGDISFLKNVQSTLAS